MPTTANANGLREQQVEGWRTTTSQPPWTNQTKLLDADDDDANVDVAGRICQFAQLSLWASPREMQGKTREESLPSPTPPAAAPGALVCHEMPVCLPGFCVLQHGPRP